MSDSPKRDWTQHDIVEETRRRHTGPGLFNVFHKVTEKAFSGALAADFGTSRKLPRQCDTWSRLRNTLRSTCPATAKQRHSQSG